MTHICKLLFLLLTIYCINGVPSAYPTTASNTSASSITTTSSVDKEISHLTTEIKTLTQKLLNCKSKDKLWLRLRRFKNRKITCNDGTTAGYYIKRSYESNKWIIYLEGGWYCYDDQSCDVRMNTPNMKRLMSSSHWPPKRQGTGILSINPKENPTWWNANHVFVPYCSSDAWSGNVSTTESGGKFSFMGYRIINEVITELLPQGFLKSEQLLFAGSSAGAIGIIMNVDRVAEMMKTKGSSSEVRALSDSGWYIESKPDLSSCAIDPTSCNKPSDVIKKGMRYWKGVVPRKCAEEFKTEPWHCYFGHNVYRTLKSPLFIFQWQYDQTQMVVKNLAAGMINGQSSNNDFLKKIFKLAVDIKMSMVKNAVSAAFLPACLSHSILTSSDWLSTKVKGYNLDRALNCWLKKDHQRNSTPSPNPPFTHCKTILIDACSFPNCNGVCPPAIDLFTRKPIQIPNIKLLSHGFPIKSSPGGLNLSFFSQNNGQQKKK